MHPVQLTLEELRRQQGKNKEGEKVMDKATDNNTVIDGKKVPYKLPAVDPAKSKTQGQKAVQVKKVPFKGVF